MWIDDYLLGVNYWASHAGIRMWRDWNEDAVEKDLSCLQKAGTKVLRVFPLWSDFQPLTGSVTYGDLDKLLFRGEPIGYRDVDGSGVDPVMLDRFERLADLAHAHDMKLIVALITGWMSGKMFHPEAFTNLNCISDDAVVQWEFRFVRTFVRRFRNHPAILAWSPGNETNVMCGGGAQSGSRFAVWLNNIVSTVRAEDPTHPISAGMHGLGLFNGSARIEDVGEVCDAMTVHPYPAFVPHCFTDGLTSMKAALHAASESALYADIAGKPCFGEEVGTLGPMLGDEDTVKTYLRRVLNSTWANGYPGMLWWCAFDQTSLSYDPYQRCSLERELGLFTADREEKKAVGVMRSFSAFLQTQKPLSERRRDAVCLLTLGQDNWAVAYAVNLLAKQAGFDVRFANADKPLPDAEIYLLPSLYKDGAPLRTQQALMQKVKDGATLYLSVGNVFLSGFENITGLRIVESMMRSRQNETVTRVSDGKRFALSAQRKWRFVPRDAEVLATEEDGNPALTKKSYGKGTVLFLSFPLEQWLADLPDAFGSGDGKDYYVLYKDLFAPYLHRAVTNKSSPFWEITEHPLTPDACEITAVSYTENEPTLEVTLAPRWHAEAASVGAAQANGNKLILTPKDGLCRVKLRLHGEKNK